MSQDLCKWWQSLQSQTDPQWSQEVQLFTLQQIIWESWQFEDPLPHSHWGETAQVQPMQLLSQWCFPRGHIMKHTGEKPHQCIAMQPMRLYFNPIKRSEEPQKDPLWGKPYRCTMCEFSNITTDQLKQHMMRNHTGEKPFKCNQCNYTCVSSGELQSHTKTHMGARRLSSVTNATTLALLMVICSITQGSTPGWNLSSATDAAKLTRTREVWRNISGSTTSSG